MITLHTIKDQLYQIINGVPNSRDIEFAIFSNNCDLIASTDNYLEKKGTSVHKPSLEEVMSIGHVLVNNPGYMPSCIGCRFKDNCPAKIELLQCIKAENQVIGVISMTSFTSRGHTVISKNLDFHLALLDQIANLISIMATHFARRNEFIYLDNAIKLVIQNEEACKMIVDKDGFISHQNNLAINLFSHCNLYSNSIKLIFPENIVSEILNGSHISREYVNLELFSGMLSSTPITENSKFIGAVITIEKQTKKRTSLIEPKIGIDNILGKSPSISKMKEIARKISGSSSTVLIMGETGTGKEMFAKAIHYGSPRANEPLVSINCASIPENLFESELFGYEEGAFTGAKKGGKIGRIELAQNGTLFLDEIGELPLFMQSKLLRVLQENKIEKVGGTRSIPVDIRFIFATNKNLETMVENNTFRADLYYRLNVIPLRIPRLAGRQEDIEILSMDFLKKYNFKLSKRISGFTDESILLLKQYDWPGNVRELENAVEYAVNMEETAYIQKINLPEKISNSKPETNSNSIKETVKHTEFETIKASLDKHGWTVEGKKEAAKELGIGLRTLYRKIKAYENGSK